MGRVGNKVALVTCDASGRPSHRKELFAREGSRFAIGDLNQQPGGNLRPHCVKQQG